MERKGEARNGGQVKGEKDFGKIFVEESFTLNAVLKKKEKNMNWNDLDYETRLKITAYIFEELTKDPPCSFRRLIYDRLGFKPDAYTPLYQAGGMAITNALSAS